MQIGLSESSKIKEEVVKVDDKTAIRYRVVEERIDLKALRNEKEMLKEQLNMKEPAEEELIELGKSISFFYQQDKSYLQARIKEINNILDTINGSHI